MRCGLRALPSCAPINRDHAREHDRKSDFCFAIGNETRNPPRPIKYGCVACAKVAKRPNHKTGCVNRPADSFGMCHPTPFRFSDAGHRRWPGRREFNRRGSKSKAPPSLRLVDRSLANRRLTLGPAQVLFREAKKLFVAAIDGWGSPGGSRLAGRVRYSSQGTGKRHRYRSVFPIVKRNEDRL